jgi:N-acetyl-alpha-D-muramate 1-phosphate uridylyltransferase
MIKKAMILGAGFGKRLNPLTLNCPKLLLKIGNETLLSNTINFLQNFKIKEIVINVHYLENQIIEYVKKNKFDAKITIVNEKNKILDTGGGILNALKYLNESFICINPDTVWNLDYIREVKELEKNFLSKKKCHLLVVNKLKSFDKNLKGDFDLVKDIIVRKKKEDLKFIYTGLQIINPEIFKNIDEKVFSINKVWDQLISTNQLFALESNINFKHVSTLDIYNKLNIK